MITSKMGTLDKKRERPAQVQLWPFAGLGITNCDTINFLMENILQKVDYTRKYFAKKFK